MSILTAADPTRHSPVEDAQGIGFGVLMAGVGVHLLTHMGFVSGQMTGLAVIAAHLTGLPYPLAFFGLSAPFILLGWRRMGAVFALKTLITTAALTGLIAVLPGWLELGAIQPALAAGLIGLLFGIAALAVVRHGGSFGGLSVLWIELQDRTGFRAGTAQLLSDVAIFAVAALILPPEKLLWSFASAATFAVFMAINHRRDRYVAL